jgi:hypothetical protein
LESLSHCPDCKQDFVVEYRASTADGIGRPLVIDCPECRSKVTITLPPGTLIYLARRRGWSLRGSSPGVLPKGAAGYRPTGGKARP